RLAGDPALAVLRLLHIAVGGERRQRGRCRDQDRERGQDTRKRSGGQHAFCVLELRKGEVGQLTYLRLVPPGESVSARMLEGALLRVEGPFCTPRKATRSAWSMP